MTYVFQRRDWVAASVMAHPGHNCETAPQIPLATTDDQHPWVVNDVPLLCLNNLEMRGARCCLTWLLCRAKAVAVRWIHSHVQFRS